MVKGIEVFVIECLALMTSKGMKTGVRRLFNLFCHLHKDTQVLPQVQGETT